MGAELNRVRLWRMRTLAASFAVLLACQAILILDVLGDAYGIDILPWHFELETIELLIIGGQTLSLIAIGWTLAAFWREHGRYREVVRTASGQLLETINRRFDVWGLTESEREVALLLIKGLSVGEIARARNSRPGTVKSQSNAVYRKAGLRGRCELAAYFVEDLLAGDSLLE